MLKVTGASDDLIEIEGDVVEEFSCYNCENGVMAFSDGTLLGVKYDDDGIWRFTPRFKGTLYDHKDDGDVGQDTNDIVYFKEGITWIAFSDDAQIATK